jgi:hypothetical protein
MYYININGQNISSELTTMNRKRETCKKYSLTVIFYYIFHMKPQFFKTLFQSLFLFDLDANQTIWIFYGVFILNLSRSHVFKYIFDTHIQSLVQSIKKRGIEHRNIIFILVIHLKIWHQSKKYLPGINCHY